MFSKAHLSKCGPNHEFQLTHTPQREPSLGCVEQRIYSEISWMFFLLKNNESERSPDGNAATLGKESFEINSKAL